MSPVTAAPADPRFHLRRARAADAEQFAVLMADPAVYGGLLQLPWPDAETWRQRLTAQAAPGQPDLHLVAVTADGRLIGSAGVHAASPALRRRHAMGLGISVAPDWQGQGVGTALMAGLCDYADRWLGVLRLELTVYADNARALALYERFGFEREGLMRAYALRDGVYVDTVAMARLRAPAPPFGTGSAFNAAPSVGNMPEVAPGGPGAASA